MKGEEIISPTLSFTFHLPDSLIWVSYNFTFSIVYNIGILFSHHNFHTCLIMVLTFNWIQNSLLGFAIILSLLGSWIHLFDDILSRSRVILSQRVYGCWIFFIHFLLLQMQALLRVVPVSTTSQTQNHVTFSHQPIVKQFKLLYWGLFYLIHFSCIIQWYLVTWVIQSSP